MRQAAILALVLGLACWVGCGKKDGTKPADAGKDGKGAAAAKAETPKDVVISMGDALKADRDAMNKTPEKWFTKNAAQVLKWIAEEENSPGPEIVKFEVKDEKIDGDNATVKMNSTEKKKDGKEESEVMVFVLKKEDGKWKIFKIGGEEKQEDLEAAYPEMKKMQDEKKK